MLIWRLPIPMVCPIQVLHDVDGCRLNRCAELDPPYDHVVFNFPHCGLGIKDKVGVGVLLVVCQRLCRCLCRRCMRCGRYVRCRCRVGNGVRCPVTLYRYRLLPEANPPPSTPECMFLFSSYFLYFLYFLFLYFFLSLFSFGSYCRVPLTVTCFP